MDAASKGGTGQTDLHELHPAQTEGHCVLKGAGRD